jgi:hypothetical protein
VSGNRSNRLVNKKNRIGAVIKCGITKTDVTRKNRLGSKNNVSSDRNYRLGDNVIDIAQNYM